jgi:hypothetical protein
MTQFGISEILEKASKIKNKSEKIKFLQQNNSPALKLVLQFALHPRVKILLPEGPAPYKPSTLADENHGMLYGETRRLYLFCEGGNPGLSQNKRDNLFIRMLESIHPNDAKLLVAAKDKKLPYKGLTKKDLEEAFPGIFD